MKLKTTFSFLLVFIVGHGCKQVYDVDVSLSSNQATPYHVFFIDKSLDDNLGVIVTDTSKREINFFYGNKNTQGNLVNIQEVITYLPEHELLLDFELDDNLLPKKITSLRNDSTTTMNFKNYDLRANTVDIDVFNTQNTLINSRTRVWCGDAILKFKEAKRLFELKKGLRVAQEMDLNSDCSPFLNSLITASNGIGCFLGIAALPVAGTVSLTGIGGIVLVNDLLFTATNCGEALGGLQAIFRGECLPEQTWLGQISTFNSCKMELKESILKRRNPVAVLLRLLGKKDGIDCITSFLGDLMDVFNGSTTSPGNSSQPSSTRYSVAGKSYGDPNIVTFDGKPYSFNGVGEFVAVKSTVDNFEIQVRQEELKSINNSGSVSWNTGLAINTGNDKLCFYPTKYFINGTQYTYSSSIDNTLQNGGSVMGNGSTLIVNTNGDVVKIFIRKDAIDYSIMPNTRRQAKMIGIFGDYNGKADNDVQIRNGSTIDGSHNSLYPTFSDSWRINQAQSLFVYESEKNTISYTDRGFPRAPLVITTSQRANAEQACKNADVQDPFLQGCINDVAATGDASLAQRAKELQDESIIRSFNLKFGPNEDMSLLKRTFNTSQYGTDYLLCDNATYPEINGSISIINGFETVIDFASEIPDLALPGLYFNLGPYEWNWSVSYTKITGNYNLYDPLTYAIRSIKPKMTMFDGKRHKILIQSAVDLNKKTSTYRLFFDDVLVSEDINFAIRSFQPQNKLIPNHQDVTLTFKTNIKLYGWSFKSY